MKDDSIKKAIEYIRPSSNDGVKYVAISMGYLVVMHFSEVLTEKLLRGFDFSDDLIDQSYFLHEQNNIKQKSPVKNF